MKEETLGPPGKAGEIYDKLKYAMLFRVVLTTLFLGTTALYHASQKESILAIHALPLYGIIAFTYFLTLIYSILIKYLRESKTFAYAQASFDMLIVTSTIYFTGGLESVFPFLYILAIFSATIVLYKPGAIFSASLASIMFGGLIDLEFYGFIPVPFGESVVYESYSPSSVLFSISMNIAAFYIVGLLSSILADQLRTTGEALMESRSDLKTLRDFSGRVLEGMPSGLITMDAEGRITMLNRAAQEITGLTFGRAAGRKLADLFEGLDLPVGARYPLVIRKRVITRENKRELFLGISAFEVPGGSEEEARRVVIFEDLTRFMEMEEEIKRSDRLAAIGKLATNIAHEIRNPLASISGSVQVMSAGACPEPERTRFMNIVVRESDRLNELITGFLNFARPVEFRLEPIRLRRLLEDTAEAVLAGVHTGNVRRVEAAFVSAGDAEAFADPQQIRQVFWNVMLNSVQAMPEGGRIEISLREIEEEPETGRRWAEVCIRDDGEGMDESMQARLFEPFFTTKPGGSGLGLAMVHKIVDQHKGRVTVKSVKGRGTEIRILLPRGAAS